MRSFLRDYNREKHELEEHVHFKGFVGEQMRRKVPLSLESPFRTNVSHSEQSEESLPPALSKRDPSTRFACSGFRLAARC
jgi:hypothetical protein